jgi:hypothetical protein
MAPRNHENIPLIAIFLPWNFPNNDDCYCQVLLKSAKNSQIGEDRLVITRFN